MPKHSFILNGKRVTVDCEDDVRLLWVIRDLLGVTGPKYGCGINVCKACTCHINGKAFNPCSVPVSKIKRTDEITTIEGLAGTVGKELHPMQEAWLDDGRRPVRLLPARPDHVAPSRWSTRSAARRAAATSPTSDIEQIRNVCRCGTYPRIREAIRGGARRCRCRPRRKKDAKPKTKKRATRQEGGRRTAARRSRPRSVGRSRRARRPPARRRDDLELPLTLVK